MNTTPRIADPPPPRVRRLDALRDQAREVLAHPTTDVVVVALVLASVVLLLVEFLLPASDPAAHGARLLGDVLTAVFAVELSARFWVARRKRRFFRKYWIDILAVLPTFRAARVFRVLRVLRLVRAGVLLHRRLLWGVGGEEGARQLTLMVTLSLALVVGGAGLLSHFEPAELGDHDEAAWYALYLLASGELVGAEPVTPGGRLVTLGLMLGGVSVFAVFVGTVSAGMMTRLVRGWDMDDRELEDLEGHLLVCGWNPSGPTLLKELFLQGDRSLHVVLITEGPRPDDLPVQVLDPDRFFHVQGDYTRVDVLASVNAPRADRAILLHDTVIPRSDQDRDARTVLAALTIEKMKPRIHTIAEVASPDTVTHLEHANVEEVVNGTWYAGVVMGASVRNPGLVAVLDEVLGHAYDNGFHTVRVPGAWAGRTVRELRTALMDDHEATLVSLHVGRERRVNPPNAQVLAGGEDAVVLARRPPRI